MGIFPLRTALFPAQAPTRSASGSPEQPMGDADLGGCVDVCLSGPLSGASRRLAARISSERAGSAAATARASTGAPTNSLSICSAHSRRAQAGFVRDGFRARGAGRLLARRLARELTREGASHSLDGLCKARLHRRSLASGVCRQRTQRAPARRIAAVIRGEIAADASLPTLPARVPRRLDQRRVGLRGARRARLHFQLFLGGEVIVEAGAREARPPS